MSDPRVLAELQRKIRETDAARALLQQQYLAASQQSHYHDQPTISKLSARSQSTAGYATTARSMSQASSDDRALKRQRRALSQQMNRNASNRSETGPFRQTGASLQPLAAPNRPLSKSRAQSTLSPSQETMAAPDVGVRPDVFIAGFSTDQPYLAMTAAELSPMDISNTLPVSKCPSMVSGWSAGDGLTPMTRQNSFLGDNTMTGVNMTRWASGSQSSFGFVDDNMFPLQGQQPKQQYFDQDFIGMGAGTDMARSFSSSMQSNTLLLSSPDSSFDSAAMERSQSNESTSSTRSTASSKRRYKEAADRVKKASQVALAPKPLAEGQQKPRVTAIKKVTKVAVPKNTYQRRKPTKVFCNQCTEQPEGFRGDHELRRHISAKHEGIVKKFICRDPASVGIHTDLEVVKPLANCKQCRAEKQYGAYYNAAAHLRRQHFVPRVSRAKGKSEEKRGGKGGGDWPPMHELKAWFEERRVPADRADVHETEQDDSLLDSAEVDMDFDMNPYALNNGIAQYDMSQLGEGSFLEGSAPAASAEFGLEQYAAASPIQGMMLGFMDDGSQMYGTAYSAGNSVVTSTNIQDMGQLPLADGAWPATI